jgi:GTP-binding protein
MIDATEGITHRDLTLIKEVYNLALPMIVCVNKMDLLDKKQKDYIMKQTQAKLDFASYVPIVPLVATSGDGIPNIMKMVKAITKEAYKRIDTGELNRAITKDMISRPPRFPKNKICKIFYATQVDVNAPTFVIFVNYVARANFAFKKWIENTIRKYYGFV